MHPEFERLADILGMNIIAPSPADHLLECAAKVFEHPAVYKVEGAIGFGSPDLLRDDLAQIRRAIFGYLPAGSGMKRGEGHFRRWADFSQKAKSINRRTAA